MHRLSLIDVLRVFPDDGSITVLLDRMVVTYWRRTCSMEPLRAWHELRSTTDLGLGYGVPVRRKDSREAWEIHWRCAGCRFRLCIPKHRTRGLYTTKLQIEFNPLRVLRQQLSPQERRLHLGPADAKDNMLDPRVVRPEEAHRRVVQLVPAMVLEGRRDFIAIVRGLFGSVISEEEVRITPSQVEFAWDRPCDAPNTAMHAMSPAWLATVPQARKRYRIGREEEDPCVELGGHGVMKASFRRGWVLKLYPLPTAALRYESQLTARVIREILGRGFCLIDEKQLQIDLAEISQAVYGPIVEVQRSMEPSRIPSAEQVLTALAPMNSQPLAGLIAGQLVTWGKVRCNRSTPSVYKVVRRMRDLELMQKSKERGYWEPMPSFALLVQAVVRQCIVLTGRTRRRPGACRVRARRPARTIPSRSSAAHTSRTVNTTRVGLRAAVSTRRIAELSSPDGQAKQTSARTLLRDGARSSHKSIGISGPRAGRRHRRRTRQFPKDL